MRAMGIDPGTAICGFGVVDSVQGRLRPVTYGTIQTTPDHTDAERLVTIYNGLHQLYDKYKPDFIGVEQLLFCLQPSKQAFLFLNLRRSKSSKASQAMAERRRNRSLI